MKRFDVDENGFYGRFGGAYVPDKLRPCIEELQTAYLKIMETDGFRKDYDRLLRHYVGRPSPLYLAERLSDKYGCRIYLKREDLNHTGAHKINNAIGQALIAQSMGKRRIIAETGTGWLRLRCVRSWAWSVSYIWDVSMSNVSMPMSRRWRC